MSATTVPVPISTQQSPTRAVHLALVALAVVVLLALSFVVGRATGTTTTTRAPSIVPTAGAHTNVDSCPRFGFC